MLNAFLNYVRTHKVITALAVGAAFLIVLGLFCRREVSGDIPLDSAYYAPQPMMQRNYPYYRQPPVCQTMPFLTQLQPAGFQSNSLHLAMGVTLQGRGTVVAVEPGSPAAQAGIQIGDVINRINGQ